MKRFSIEEIMCNKSLFICLVDCRAVKSRFYVIDINSGEIKGYITLNQFLKLQTRPYKIHLDSLFTYLLVEVIRYEC